MIFLTIVPDLVFVYIEWKIVNSANMSTLRGTEAENSPLFLWHNFIDFMEKELCTKFDILISSHEVIKFKNFESGMSDVITANIQNNSSFS